MTALVGTDPFDPPGLAQPVQPVPDGGSRGAEGGGDFAAAGGGGCAGGAGGCGRKATWIPVTDDRFWWSSVSFLVVFWLIADSALLRSRCSTAPPSLCSPASTSGSSITSHRPPCPCRLRESTGASSQLGAARVGCTVMEGCRVAERGLVYWASQSQHQGRPPQQLLVRNQVGSCHRSAYSGSNGMTSPRSVGGRTFRAPHSSSC